MIGLRGLEVDPRARTCSAPAALAQHPLARAAPPDSTRELLGGACDPRGPLDRPRLDSMAIERSEGRSQEAPHSTAPFGFGGSPVSADLVPKGPGLAESGLALSPIVQAAGPKSEPALPRVLCGADLEPEHPGRLRPCRRPVPGLVRGPRPERLRDRRPSRPHLARPHGLQLCAHQRGLRDEPRRLIPRAEALVVPLARERRQAP